MMMNRSHILAPSASLLLVVLAFAQPNIAVAQANAALEQCAAIDSESQRLACYDRLLRVPSPSDTAEPESSTDERAVNTARNAAVPAAEPETRSERRSRRRRNRDAEPGGETVVIVKVRTSISDLSVFTTEDGRIYAQTSTDSIRPGEPPFNARLEPASFGSFFLSPEGSSRRVRVSLRE